MSMPVGVAEAGDIVSRGNNHTQDLESLVMMILDYPVISSDLFFATKLLLSEEKGTCQ